MSGLRNLPYTIWLLLFDLTVKLLNKFDIKSMYLFGSYARGDWLEDSDIDLIVVSNYFRNINWIDRLSMLRKLASFNHAFEILAYTKEEFNKKLKGLNIITEASKYWIKITCNNLTTS